MLPRLLDQLDLQAFTDAARQIPYQQIISDIYPDLDVWIRRDDLIDPLISGNKAYKLFFNLLEARAQGVKTIITCGGAWSNHIHAIAAAGARFKFETIGVIRGERPIKLSATLQDAERFGMKLIFVTRVQYRRRSEPEFLKEIGVELEDSYYVPEGGSNLAGVEGIQLLGQVIEETAPVDFDQIWVACGTGATFAGLYSSIHRAAVVGVEVLKGGGSILKNARYWLDILGASSEKNGVNNLPIYRHLPKIGGGCLLEQYHGGGYGKYKREFREFHRLFEVGSVVPVDPVYTLKLLYALWKSRDDGQFPASKTRVLLIHSGGLQGRRGYK